MSSSSADSYRDDKLHHSKETSPAPRTYETDSSNDSSAGKEYLPGAHASSPEIEVPHEGSTHYITEAIALGTYSAWGESDAYEPVKRCDVPPLRDGDICSASSMAPVPPEEDGHAAPQRLPHLVASPEKRGAPPTLDSFSSPIKQSTPSKTGAGTRLNPLSAPGDNDPYRRASLTPTKPTEPQRGSVVTPINSPSKWAGTGQLTSFNSSRSPMALAKRDPVPMEQSMSSYNRNYNLTSAQTPHRRVSQDLLVSRSLSGAKKPDWGSNLKEKKPVAKESFGKIELSPKNKYDYLSEGQQLRYVEPAEHARRRSSQVIFTEPAPSEEQEQEEEENEPELAVVTRKQRSAPSSASGGTPGSPTASTRVRSIRRLFDIVDFDKAQTDFQAGNTNEKDCERATDLFATLSNNKEKILVEDLHELFVLFTTPGASAREASDFLWEECDRKIALTLADFMVYGPKLKTRLFSYENFTTFTDDEKFIHIHARLFPYKPLEKSGTGARKQILKAEKHLRQNPSTSPFRPLRVYEYEFVLNYQKRLLAQGLISADEVPPDNITGRVTAGSTTTTRLRQSLTAESANAPLPRSREQPDWGGGGTSTAARGTSTTQAQTAASGLATQEEEAAGTDDPAYPALAKCNAQTPEAKRNRYNQQRRLNSTNNTPSSTQHSTRRSGGGTKEMASSRKLFPGSTSTTSKTKSRSRSNKGSSRRSDSNTRNSQRPPFVNNAHVKNLPSKKYLGRPVEEDYAERLGQDEQLLAQIQNNYNRQ